jgi:hypothetical protein
MNGIIIIRYGFSQTFDLLRHVKGFIAYLHVAILSYNYWSYIQHSSNTREKKWEYGAMHQLFVDFKKA